MLAYATGGGIGSNAESRVVDNCDTGNCGPDLGSGSSDDFRVGWTVGGGLEYALNCHWSVRVEYLYFNLEENDIHFHNEIDRRFNFDAETDGNIVRADLNFKF
ncbi:MAG: outer membrane beta-barrel protein [Spartobacteria bacterium]